MAIQSKEVLKSYFETGDVPTQHQFEDLIDTMATNQIGKYYGYYENVDLLPVSSNGPGYAYVGEESPYLIYNYDGSGTSAGWVNSGIEVDVAPVGNGEDINQNSENKLQFANRVPNYEGKGGMGYKILRKDAGLTFANQVTDENTIYEIRYDFDLDGASVTIPSGCVLKFNGGKVSNGSILGMPKIEAADYQIFENIITDVLYVESEWVGVFAPGNQTTNSQNLQDFLDNHTYYDSNYGERLVINFSKKYLYNFGDPIVISHGRVSFKGVVPENDYMAQFAIRQASGTFITILNAQAQFENIAFSTIVGNSNVTCLDYKRSEDLTPAEGANDTDGSIVNCTFAWTGVGIRLTGRQTRVLDCTFVNTGVGVLIDDLLTSGNYGAGRNNVVRGCFFHGAVGVCIKNIGEYQQHLTIENNIKDVGLNTFFEGYLKGGRIANNNIHYPAAASQSIFELYDVENSYIFGNKCDYAYDLPNGTLPITMGNNLEHFVHVTGYIKNTEISSNKFGKSQSFGFYFEGNAEDVSIINNKVIDCCIDTTRYSSDYRDESDITKLRSIIYVAGTISNVYIDDGNNVVNLADSFTIPAYYNPNFHAGRDKSEPITAILKSGGVYKIGKLINNGRVACGALIISSTLPENAEAVVSQLVFHRDTGGLRSSFIPLLSCSSLGCACSIDTNNNIYFSSGIATGFVTIIPFGAGIEFYSPRLLSSAEVSAITTTNILKSRVRNNALYPTRPTNIPVGFSQFDEILGKPTWWNGTNWVDASGTIV